MDVIFCNKDIELNRIEYNSFLTRRHADINYFASSPLNASNITVMKVSDVDVVRVRPELLFSIYKCCFLACFCARLRAELTLAQRRCGDGPEVAPPIVSPLGRFYPEKALYKVLK